MSARGPWALGAGLAAVGLACSACAGGAPQAGPVCSQAETAPIQAATLIDALKANGISAFPQEASPICSAEDVAWFVANTPDLVQVDEQATAEEGLVLCSLRTEALYPPAVRRVDDGAEADFFLANAQCSVYTSGDEPDRARQVERLNQAMLDLAQVVATG